MTRLLALGLAVVWIVASVPSADARDRRHRTDARGTSSAEGRREARQESSSTVGRNGACQRDNGRPLDSLRLNRECDREEFWARMNDRGDNRR